MIDSDTARKLGFKINQRVKLAHRLFANHGLKYVDIGEGVVYGKHLPTENDLPALIVQFVAQKEIFNCKLLFDMLFIRADAAKAKHILMSVHPMYLDKVEIKKRHV